MHKHLAVLTIFLAILSHSEAAPGQNITSATPSGNSIVEANGSSKSSKTEDTAKSQEVSLHASAEAKRLYKEAVKYGRGGLFRQASELFQKAILLNPNYAEAHYGLGHAYFDQGQWDEAIRSFENAVKINPKDKKARARLDEAYVLAGRKSKPAPESEEKAVAADPISTNSWVESRSRNVTQAIITPSDVASSSVTPANVAPANVAPSSVTPASDVPASDVPASAAPASAAPASDVPASVASANTAPASAVPANTAPASAAPASAAPASDVPASVAPSNTAPASAAPSSVPAALSVPDTLPDNSSSASTAGNDLTRIYHIGIGDVLDVRLGHEPATQSTLFTVTPSGLLEHPILSEPLRVSGLTVEETTARLEADLKRRAVNENPKVLVGVREYLSHAIIVSGLVKEPGTKLLRREAIPLYVVIADAQPAPDAGRATVISHATGEVTVVDLSKSAEMNRLVRSGDVITVHAEPKQFFYVGGEVKAPGEKQFRPGLTLTQAILTAGGLIGESKKAHIARASDNGFLASTRYKLKDINSGKLEDPLIQPGDRITVEH